tara:strand:+ start:1262 stop:2281 length:1020 start_codon:yes stop_codon:yes gene_type:complete
MAVNKNFVVKNGLEVNSDLILADSTNKKVGIGSTIPQYTLDVIGGIGATDIYASGIATVIDQFHVGTGGTVVTTANAMVGVGTTNPAYLLDVRSGSGATTGTTVLYVQGDATVTGNLDVAGDIQYDQVTGRELYISGLSTFVGMSTFKSDIFVAGVSTFVGVSTFHNDVHIGGNLNVTGDIVYDEVTGRNIYISGLSTFVGVSTHSSTLFTKDLYVTGVSTFAGALAGEDALYISSNVGVGTTNAAIAADSNNTTIVNAGIVTANYIYGDGSGLTNITATSGGAIGIQSGTTYIGSGITALGISGSNSSLTISTPSSGFSTITLPSPGVSLGLAIALGG